jgi:hypothetical protein
MDLSAAYSNSYDVAPECSPGVYNTEFRNSLSPNAPRSLEVGVGVPCGSFSILVVETPFFLNLKV